MLNKIEININQMVKVKLDKKALDRKQKEIDELSEKIGESLKLPIDEDGYYKGQLWCIMKDFGDMIVGGYSPILDCKIVIEF